MHGPLLPKNREITDRLISNCLKSKYQNFTELEDIDSTYEDKCKDFLLNRFNIK